MQVPAAEVAAFEELVRGGGYLELPAEVEPAAAPEDATELTWTIELDGRRHRVTAREAGPSWNPVLRALDAELQGSREALNRERTPPSREHPRA